MCRRLTEWHSEPMSRLAALVALVAIAASGAGATGEAGNLARVDLTFTRVQGERYSVWVAHSDGSFPRRVVESGSGGKLSSDGRWLAYWRVRYGRYGARFLGRYVADLASGKSRRIGGKAYDEHWSPAAAVLAVSDARSLYVVDPAFGSRKYVVRGRHVYSFSFSPDGLAIAYARSNGRSASAYRSDLYAVRLAFEFGCRRVTFTGPDGRRFGWPALEPFERKRGTSALDLSPDGDRVLVDVGSPHDDRNHDVYAFPFAGGESRLIAHNAVDASWRH